MVSSRETPSNTTADEWQRTWHGLWEILGCKWTFHILRVLTTKPDGCGFNELERDIDGITAAMLSRRLDQLIDERIIEKSIRPTSPPSSLYRLTETGTELARTLRQIERLKPRSEE